MRIDPVSTPPSVSGARVSFPQAIITFVPWQKRAGMGMILVIFFFLLLDYRLTLLTVNGAVTVFYIASMLYRTMLIDISLRRSRDIVVREDQLCPPEGEWPRYLVQVPLYREGAILPHLVASMKKLDYPIDKLEVRLLIEEDDAETMEAARGMNLS